MTKNKTTGTTSAIKEPETKSDKKAAKAVSGKTKGEGKAVKQAKEKAEPKAKGPTIGATAIELLKSGKSAKETLATVLEKFPGAKTTMSCIYWYANHEGIKLQRPAAPKAAKPAKQDVAAA